MVLIYTLCCAWYLYLKYTASHLFYVFVFHMSLAHRVCEEVYIVSATLCFGLPPLSIQSNGGECLIPSVNTSALFEAWLDSIAVSLFEI